MSTVVKRIIWLLVVSTMALATMARAHTIDLDVSSKNGAVDISKGGTDATTAADARENLGVGATDDPAFNTVTLSVAEGTAPATVTSTTKVDNLNCDMIDGLTSAEFQQANTLLSAFSGLALTAGDMIYAASSSSLGVVQSGAQGDLLIMGATAPAFSNSLPITAIDLTSGTYFRLPASSAPTLDVSGKIAFDTTITAFTGGAVRYYNGSALKQLVDMTSSTAEACTDDQVVAYDSAAKLWYCKDDATGTPAADSVSVSQMADGDWGDFTITSNVASLDSGSVLANEIGAIAEQKDWAITSPDDDDVYLFKAQRAITVTDIHCIAVGGGSITIDIQECSSTGTSCSTVDANITCDSNGAEDDGTLSNGAIDAGDWVYVDMGTVSGTVTSMTFSVFYTEDK